MNFREALYKTQLQLKRNNQFGYVKFENPHAFFGTEKAPVELNIGGLFICLQGNAEFIIDGHTYIIKKGDLCVCFPNTIMQNQNRTEDFKGLAIAMNMDLIISIQLPSIVSYYLHIKENPCISLSAEEQQKLTELCEKIIKLDEEREHLFAKEISENLLMVICYEIANLYAKNKPIKQQKSSQKEVIFQKFINSLVKNYKTNHSLTFYAQEACISPRYLSTIVKEVSGLSVTQWVHKARIAQAQTLLKATKMTIQEISDELYFPNPSFFSQFFKKYTGFTPKMFRNNTLE